MGPGANINIRFTNVLLEQIDAYLATLLAQNPGANINRSDVIRMAVEQLTRPAKPTKKTASSR